MSILEHSKSEQIPTIQVQLILIMITYKHREMLNIIYFIYYANLQLLCADSEGKRHDATSTLYSCSSPAVTHL